MSMRKFSRMVHNFDDLMLFSFNNRILGLFHKIIYDHKSTDFVKYTFNYNILNRTTRMGSTRIKKIGGIYQTGDFTKIIRQLNGRAILAVAIINSPCDECSKMLKFVHQLEGGFIDKLPQLVMIYGISNQKTQKAEDGKKEPKPVAVNESDNQDEEKASPKVQNGGKEKKALGDSRFLVWDGLPHHHGYALFLSHEDVLYYTDIFDHDEFVSNIVDNIRRFKSSIKTIEGLTGKRKFLKSKRTGIIVETNSATPQSQIMKIEEKVKSFEGKLPTAVYFCKGLAQEMSLVRSGEIIIKKRGLQLDKFLKKIAKSNLSE